MIQVKEAEKELLTAHGHAPCDEELQVDIALC